MANRSSAPTLDSRPTLTRSRSSSSPTATRDHEKSQTTTRPARPSHFRSRSYVHPVNSKASSAGALPSSGSEKPVEPSRFHRLHLPGRLHHHHGTADEEPKSIPRAHHGRHRYTQSDAQQHHRKRESTLLNSDSPNTPTNTTPASSNSEHHNDVLYPSSRGTVPSLMRMASTRSHRGNTTGEGPRSGALGTDSKTGQRRRANSDPRSPGYDSTQNQIRPAHKSPIELELERADYLRRTAIENATEADLKRTNNELKAATYELEDRMSNTTRSASDLMRRLDDAQDTLFRTTESLVDTISSFTNLSDQSSKLVSNFEHESRHLDHETRQRVSRFRTSICKNRSHRVDTLEQRGQTMSQKAEELGRRLENCRTIIRNWEEREINKRRAWRGVWVGTLWGVALIAIAVLAGVASWKAAEIDKGGGTIDERLRHRIVHNRSQDVGVLRHLEVPEDVREILIDIDARTRKGRVLKEPVVDGSGGSESRTKDDRWIRLFDDL